MHGIHSNKSSLSVSVASFFTPCVLNHHHCATFDKNARLKPSQYSRYCSWTSPLTVRTGCLQNIPHMATLREAVQNNVWGEKKKKEYLYPPFLTFSSQWRRFLLIKKRRHTGSHKSWETFFQHRHFVPLSLAQSCFISDQILYAEMCWKQVFFISGCTHSKLAILYTEWKFPVIPKVSLQMF